MEQVAISTLAAERAVAERVVAERAAAERVWILDEHSDGFILPVAPSPSTTQVPVDTSAGESLSCESLSSERLIQIPAGESLSWVLVLLPGAPALPSLKFVMMGEGANLSLNILCIARADERQNIKVEVEHRTPGATSSQLVRSIIGGNARVRYDSLIKVFPDAQKTQADQNAQALLLSDTARVVHLPQLEIYADDVKCSHGAASGNLDENAQFYMRSRGLTLEQAQLLQLQSFVCPVLQSLSQEEQREALMEQIQDCLPTLL